MERSENKPEHGNAYQCGKCGTKRQSFGNGLFIWDVNKMSQKRKMKLKSINPNLQRFFYKFKKMKKNNV